MIPRPSSGVSGAGGAAGVCRSPHSHRQSGHVECVVSHRWMHFVWKACSSEQGSTFSSSASQKSLMQMAHWEGRQSAARSPPLTPTSTLCDDGGAPCCLHRRPRHPRRRRQCCRGCVARHPPESTSGGLSTRLPKGSAQGIGCLDQSNSPGNSVVQHVRADRRLSSATESRSGHRHGQHSGVMQERHQRTFGDLADGFRLLPDLRRWLSCTRIAAKCCRRSVAHRGSAFRRSWSLARPSCAGGTWTCPLPPAFGVSTP